MNIEKNDPYSICQFRNYQMPDCVGRVPVGLSSGFWKVLLFWYQTGRHNRLFREKLPIVASVMSLRVRVIDWHSGKENKWELKCPKTVKHRDEWRNWLEISSHNSLLTKLQKLYIKKHSIYT